MIETLKKEEIASLQKLADLNVAISEANSTFESIKGKETEYVKIREEKVEKQIEELLKNSTELLTNTHKNYEGIHTFCNILTNYKEFLEENYSEFSKMLADFEAKSKEWDRRYEEQIIEFGRQEKIIREDEKKVEDSKREIEKATKQIERDKIKIADERESIKRIVERFKLNKK